jgi:hypothetical protein
MLPAVINPDEVLARVACGSSKLTKNKALFYKDDETGIIRANVTLFMDARNPAELSVNRIFTLSEGEAHKLGETHRAAHQPTATYWGYAQINASICFSKNCEVIKDDMGGTKPYHANIVFPKDASFQEIQAIATYFAFKSLFTINPLS